MFDRSTIMKAAWEKRIAYYRARPHLPRRMNRSDFAFYLACAWQEAKTAAMSFAERRVNAIAVEIDRLKFKSLRVNIAQRRRVLEAELASIVG